MAFSAATAPTRTGLSSLSAHKLQCDFDASGRCLRCGRQVLTDPRQTFAVCRVRCEHLGEAVGITKVACHCPNRPTTETPAHICRRHGRCLPKYRPSAELLEEWRLRQPEASIYHLCSGCESFRAAAAAT